MNKARLSVAVLTLWLVVAVGAVAGAAQPPEWSMVSFFVAHNGWEEKGDGIEEDLGESVFGVRLKHFLQPSFVLDASGTFSRASYSDITGSESDLSTLNDTRIKGTYLVNQGFIQASVLLNLPTGKRSLSADEYLVAAGVADNSRKFAVRRFGQGLDVGGELFLAPETGNVLLRAGGGYLHKGAYQARAADEDKYKFGDEIYGLLRVSAPPEPLGFEAIATYRIYADDELASEPVYRSGNALIVTGRVQYRANVSVSLGAGIVTRGKAQVLASGQAELVEEELKSSRDETFLNATLTIPIAAGTRLIGRAEYRRLAENDMERTSGLFRPAADYMGFGGGIGQRLSTSVYASIVPVYYSGSVDEDRDLSGLGVTGAITLRY